MTLVTLDIAVTKAVLLILVLCRPVGTLNLPPTPPTVTARPCIVRGLVHMLGPTTTLTRVQTPVVWPLARNRPLRTREPNLTIQGTIKVPV